MQRQKRLHYPSLICFLLLTSWTSIGFSETSQSSDSDSQSNNQSTYQEVTYDDLLNQLSKKKTQLHENKNSPFDKIMFHAGFGLIASALSVKIDDKDRTKYQNGFQLSLGVDLFSEVWATEGVLRNFGTVKSGHETRSLREFDLKVFHRIHLNADSKLRMGAGLGTRYLKINDDLSGLAINDNTPVTTVFGGLDSFLSKSTSLGVEAGFRTAMISRTHDKNSVDFTVRLDIYF